VGSRLEYSQHDRADKGESDIGGDNAQSADDAHGTPPLFAPLPVTEKANHSFLDKKVRRAVYADLPQPEPWLKLREINALKIG
jgi:hypothetical protein